MAAGHPYPLGTGTQSRPDLVSSTWPWPPAAAVAIVAALASAGLAMLLGRAVRPGRILAGTALAFSAALAVAFFTLVADSGMLAVAGYIPFLLVTLVSDPQALAARSIPWAQFANEYALLAGVGLWAGNAVVAVRRYRGACAACGRSETADRTGHGSLTADGRTPAHSSHRWGQAATWIAVAAPLAYAAVRLAWAAGIPLGMSDQAYQILKGEDGLGAAAGLGGMAVLGAVLTCGLVARWGERIPSWVPILGGRRVPVAAAVVPALAVAAMILPASTMMVRASLGLASAVPSGISWSDWGAYAPGLLWPLWAVALAAAAIAYWLRRRGTCTRCGRGN